MAIQQVQYIPPQEKTKTTSGRKGGGKFGTLAGLAAGAALGGAVVASGGAAAPAATAAAPAAGAAAAPAAATAGEIAFGAMGGAATGSGLGGLLGESVRPGREASTAIERRIQTQGAQPVRSEASEKLKQSLMALHQAPPEIKSQYAPQLMSAYLTSVAKDRGIGA